MNLSELQFINHHKLPVKIMLLNNGGYHAISSMQAPLPHLRSDLTTARRHIFVGLCRPNDLLCCKTFIQCCNALHWVLQDNLFPGNRIGCNPATGVSIPSFEKIAAAYILPL